MQPLGSCVQYCTNVEMSIKSCQPDHLGGWFWWQNVITYWELNFNLTQILVNVEISAKSHKPDHLGGIFQEELVIPIVRFFFKPQKPQNISWKLGIHNLS